MRTPSKDPAAEIRAVARRYQAARERERDAMADLRAAVVNGSLAGITKEELIRLSGLARGTVYRALADE